jgi:hypothetical protein
MPKNWDEIVEKPAKVIKQQHYMPTEIQINDLIDKLCVHICGKAPTHISECKGYSTVLQPCERCLGTGKVKPTIFMYDIKEIYCTKCGGTGNQFEYQCKVRLLSDNINFAREMNWSRLIICYYKELREVIKDDKDVASNT